MGIYSALQDHELLALLKNNDEAAFTEIYNRYWEPMSRYVLKVIRHPDDAKDIVQEVLVSIWKRRQQLTVSGPLAAYLLKSVRNLSIRYIENNISRHNFLHTLSEHTKHLDLSAINVLELQELEAKLADAIAKLPPKMKEVFILSRHENLSYHEIALQLGISEATVKKQVNNALKNIKTDLGGVSSTWLIYMILLHE